METRGERNIRWIEENCVVPEGELVGQPVVLLDWQKKEILRLYDNPAITRKCFWSFGKKNGKGLALDTPIPTPDGWRTMGDLREGDFVFGADGQPTKVLLVSEIHHLRCWRLGFSDGTSIVADESHRWMTTHRQRPWAKARRSGSGNGGRWVSEVVQTPQIAASLSFVDTSGTRVWNHKITAAPATQSPDISLPVDPYVLGAWLGDGTSKSATFTSGDEDLEHFVSNLEAAIGSVVVRRYGDRASTICTPGGGLQSGLRGLGVLGRKHVPQLYFDAGTDQRWALLQGMMDTDGTVNTHGGKTTARCAFYGTNEQLVRDVWRLARSLGLKATVTSGVKKCQNGAEATCFIASFTARQADPVFRLKRKQSKLPEAVGKRSRSISIVSAEEIPSVPTVCIMVDAADSLFLAGEGCIPTHNTGLSAFLLLLHLVGPEARQNSQIVSTASSRDQAAILYDYAAKAAAQSPSLCLFVRPVDSKKQLFCDELGTRYAALSADDRNANGRGAVFAIHDEGGLVVGPRNKLVTAVGNAMGLHKNPLELFVSTQAPNDGDHFSINLDFALSGKNPKWIGSLYSAPMDLDPFSDEALLAANPAAGHFLSLDELRQLAATARDLPSEEAQYRNFNLNQRVSSVPPYLPETLWKSGNGAPDDLKKERVWIGLDLSQKHDLTARVMAGEHKGNWHAFPRFWLPAHGLEAKSAQDRVPYDMWNKAGQLDTTPGKIIDYRFIAEDLFQLCRDYDVQRIYYDPAQFIALAPHLRNVGFSEENIDSENGLFREQRQGPMYMSPLLREVEGLFLEGRVRHGGHPVLSMCAHNAIAESDSKGNRYLDKKKSTGRIDGMTALVMAIGAARLENPEPPKPKSYLSKPGAKLIWA